MRAFAHISPFARKDELFDLELCLYVSVIPADHGVRTELASSGQVKPAKRHRLSFIEAAEHASAFANSD